MPTEKTFNANAVELNYFDAGVTSADPLIMLHGGAWCWQEYLSLIPSLAKRWHIYALDLRGNGRSAWVPETYRLQDFVEDNAQFLKRLDRPAILMGHSIGGVIALMLAGQYPDMVKALILEDIVLTLDNYRGVIDSCRDMFALWLNLKQSAKSEQELALALAEAYRDYPGVTSTWILFFAKCLRQLDPTFFNALLHNFEGFAAGYDYKHIMKTINCPRLFLRGEPKLGAVMTDEEISWLQKHCSNAKCALIDGVGHLLHLDPHGQTPVLTEIVEFLDKSK